MSALLNVFFGWPIVKRIRSNNNDDQHVDRLNHRYTVGWILVGVFLSSTTTFVFNRISCWLPTELRHSSYWKYIETYCYISNTYFIPTNITPPHTNEERRDLQIGYYQWVPFILLLMALFFYIPRLFWRSFNNRSGIDIQTLIDKSRSSAPAAADLLNHYIRTKDPHSRKHRGYYLVVLYVITRVLYLINSIVQLILLHRLLGHRGGSWLLDLDIIYSILRYGNPLLNSPYFPRVTMCDVPIREFAEIHRYTLQCALPINMFNEKIFLALSLWFSYIILHNLFALLYFLYQQTSGARQRYLQRLTDLVNLDQSLPRNKVLPKSLTSDDVFLLRLIDHNCSELEATEVMKRIDENPKRRNL